MDEEQSTSQPSELASAIATLIANLPAPVREFVNGPERDRVSLELTQKYRLHADQAGEFERAYLRMLLGVDSPEEFATSLRQAGIPETDITGLTTDINDLVFKPLRRKEQEMTERRPEPPTPAPQPAPRREAPPPPAPQQPVYMPPMQGAQQQTYWVPVSITAIPQPYITTQPPPQYQMQQQPAPPPPPIPEPPKIEEQPRAPQWEAPPPPNLPTDGAPPLTKEYAADPYREPV